MAHDQHTQHVADRPGRDRTGVNRPGEAALALGIIAVVSLVVPVIGDYLAVPGALAAIGLGVVGMRRHETGRAGTAGGAVAGVILGAIALTGVVVLLAATRLPG